eukprot:352249-Chlamydomonas_euryale.AAC.7
MTCAVCRCRAGPCAADCRCGEGPPDGCGDVAAARGSDGSKARQDQEGHAGGPAGRHRRPRPALPPEEVPGVGLTLHTVPWLYAQTTCSIRRAFAAGQTPAPGGARHGTCSASLPRLGTRFSTSHVDQVRVATGTLMKSGLPLEDPASPCPCKLGMATARHRATHAAPASPAATDHSAAAAPPATHQSAAAAPPSTHHSVAAAPSATHHSVAAAPPASHHSVAGAASAGPTAAAVNAVSAVTGAEAAPDVSPRPEAAPEHLMCLLGLDERTEQLVDWRSTPTCRRHRGHIAVEIVDLGGAARKHVLQHRVLVAPRARCNLEQQRSARRWHRAGGEGHGAAACRVAGMGNKLQAAHAPAERVAIVSTTAPALLRRRLTCERHPRLLSVTRSFKSYLEDVAL